MVAMVVTTKNNLENLPNSIKYLKNLGFKKFNILFDYLVDWQDEDLEVIRKSFTGVAEIYYEALLNENDLDFPLFDEKIRTHIKEGFDCNDGCQLGMQNINVGTDGNFYPCMQFVGLKEYIIGNCEEGINTNARIALIKQSKKENDICKECAIRTRCKHLCPCKNYLTTQDINGLSPIVCEFERIIIEIADNLAEKLYKNDSNLFIQKFYNENYGIMKEILRTEEKRKANENKKSGK